ncbi:MAG: LysR substrate-binding domain-containing protein [Sterolibacterium sp.]
MPGKAIRDLPPLDALRVFEIAGRELSFTRAAERLCVSQSAVSKQISTLETALGASLFERKTRTLKLTPAGERLLRATETSLATLREAFADLRAGEEPTITLTCTPAFASLWLIPRLGEFRRLNPGIDIRISADTRVIDLEKGRFDIAVRHLSDRSAPADALRIAGGAVIAVCNPGILTAAHALNKPQDLSNHVLLDYVDETRQLPWLSWAVWLEAAGVADLRPLGRVEFNQYEGAIRAAIDGQGIALATRDLVQHLLDSGSLVTPMPQRYSNPRSYFLLVSHRGAGNPAVTVFCQWMQSTSLRSV